MAKTISMKIFSLFLSRVVPQLKGKSDPLRKLFIFSCERECVGSSCHCVSEFPLISISGEVHHLIFYEKFYSWECFDVVNMYQFLHESWNFPFVSEKWRRRKASLMTLKFWIPQQKGQKQFVNSSGQLLRKLNKWASLVSIPSFHHFNPEKLKS